MNYEHYRNIINMSLGTFICVEHYMNIYKLRTFIKDEHYRNVINMSLGTFIYMEHYMNIMNIFLEHCIKGILNIIIEKLLGNTKHYEHVFMEMLVSNV